MPLSEIPIASLSPLWAFNASLLRKFNQHGPCYAFYPTEDHFSDAFVASDYLQAVASMRTQSGRYPLSLYLQLPFWESRGKFQTRDQTITRNHRKTATYMRYLNQEIETQGKLFAGMNRVDQLHFGGGSPTYLSDDQLDDLLLHLRNWFAFAPDETGEYSINVDPRTISLERLHTLRKTGFNHINLGMQEFSSDGQKTIHQRQPENKTAALISAARDARFQSICINLIIGLPAQHIIAWARTLAKIIEAKPDRIAIYHYAHLPRSFEKQSEMAQEDLPSADATLDMLFLCTKRLAEADYVYVGMGYFAKSADALVVAQRQGRLHRNSQGYSTHLEAGLVSCGVAAISAIGATYSQNEKTLDRYYKRVAQGELPIALGRKLTMDDLLRRIIIKMLMSTFQLSIASIELGYPINFASYFSREVMELHALEDDGLLQMDAEWLTVTLKGRLLICNICIVFDTCLRGKPELASV